MSASSIRRGVVTLGNAFVVAVFTMATSVAFAAFVFSGPLAGGIGYGIDAALLCIVAGAIISLRSGFPFAIGGLDGAVTAVLALSVISWAPSEGARAVPTALVTLAIATLFSGLFYFTLGTLRAARAIRYLPYPMIGGFGAASGLVTTLAGIRLLGGVPQQIATHWPQLVIGLAFAALLLLATRRWGAIAMPIGILAAIAVGFAAAALSHVPFAELQGAGWFLSVPAGTHWIPELTAPSAVDWRAVALQSPAIVAAAVIGTMTMLVNANGLEVLTHHDVDLDAELRLAGISNIAGAFAGAMIGFVAYIRSSLNRSLGTQDRAVGILVSVIALLVVVLGAAPLVSRVPTVVPAALLVAAGGSVTYRWMIAAWRRLSVVDMLTIWAIVAIVLGFGFVPALALGVALSCVAFAARYARIDAIERRVTAATFHSTLRRSQREMEVLRTYGDRAQVYVLRGFVFFGMADAIYRELLARVAAVDGPAWIVTDFSRVTGMDSSVATAFAKLLNHVDRNQVRVLLSGMSAEVARRWNALADTEDDALMFDDLDLAMEWCENDLLRQFDSYDEEPPSFALWLSEQVGEDLAATLAGHLERVELDTGATLFAAGDEGGRMFF
ncbi:MAG TPA: SulP family inorganic anion transporter, partial [Candidatus Elarobacter sp.]